MLTQKTATLLFIMTLFAFFAALGCTNSPTEPAEQSVKIDFNLVFTGPNTAAGTFTASGAFNESGDAEETFELIGPADGPPTEVKGDKLLKGKNGNISISFDAKITTMSQTTALAEGTFSITGATGVYANLQGNGETSVTTDFAAGTLVGSYDGLVKGFK